MQMNKQEWCLIMVNRAISLIVILFFCGFISFIAINGTNEIYGKKYIENKNNNMDAEFEKLLD